MKYSIGYITVPTKPEAKNLVLALLEEGLIACGNILPAGESFFVWDNQIEETSEHVVLIKTKPSHHGRIIRLVKELHSYECPCVVFVPIEDGSNEFLDWIDKCC
ncbi:divalent-cation tolerance protein CutA [Candidatus Peregrinibacteria bacterium]|nr:divalent-cation tolerance protein CutA [Candidatus Peregrinibacteria bacterium]